MNLFGCPMPPLHACQTNADTPVSPRAMISFWISVVPSGIGITIASHAPAAQR